MDNKVKILHVIGGGEFGGAEQHILSLIDQFRNSAFDASVITFYDALFAQKLRDRGAAITVIQQYGRFDFRIINELTQFFKRINPDIIHTHGVRANFSARIAAKRANIRNVVTTVHSILKHDYPKPHTYFLAHLMERVTQSITKHFIAVSAGVKEQLLADGVKEEQITVIENGINSSLYIPTDIRAEAGRKLREEWQIPAERFVIGTLARLVPVKGLNYLIQGMAKALESEPNLHLLIVGDGPEKENLRLLAQKSGIDDHVTFAGFRSDVANCLAAIDLYINCSLSEGTSVSVMEAMAAEKPLILTYVGGMTKMAVHEESALFIPSQSAEAITDSILRIVREPMLRERLARSARAIVEERYSVEAMAQKQAEVYQQVLKGNYGDVKDPS